MATLLLLVVMENNNRSSEDSVADENVYGYCDKMFSFGVTKSTIYYPKWEFGLALLNFVAAQHHTGYVCKVSREMDQKVQWVNEIYVANLFEYWMC